MRLVFTARRYAQARSLLSPDVRPFVAEIWRYNDFRNGGRPAFWIFKIFHFGHMSTGVGATRVIVSKKLFNMAAGAGHHFEFLKFRLFLKWLLRRPLFSGQHQLSLKSDIIRGCRAPSWILDIRLYMWHVSLSICDLLPVSKFPINRTVWRRYSQKTFFSIWRLAAIFNL